MHQYLEALHYVLENGERRSNRTGIDTLSVFGHTLKFDLREGFPAVTTKKLQFSSVTKELLWFLRGETNVNTLGCDIWRSWAKEDGEVPFCYGQTWRAYPGREREVDQIAELLDRINKDPDSRRLIICAWNPEYQDQAGLAWCHAFVQFNVTPEYVDCALTQRSCDMALGVPFNIASYALLTHLIARACGRKPRFFTHYLNDMHIYVNHIEGIQQQLLRHPLGLPELVIEGDNQMWDIKPEEIRLKNYYHHAPLRFDVAV